MCWVVRRRAGPKRIRHISKGVITGIAAGLDGVQSAVSYYERALELDPEFRGGVFGDGARAHCAREPFERAGPAHRSNKRGRRRSARSRSTPAFRTRTWRSPRSGARSSGTGALAEDEYRTAIALSPSCETAHRFYAQFLAAMSRFGEAKAEADRACDVDPFCLVRDDQRGMGALRGRRVRDRDRSQPPCARHGRRVMPARRLLGAALLAAGRPDEAVVELTAAAGPDARRSDLAGVARARQGACRRARRGRRAGREARSRSARACYVPAYHLALAHVGLGNRDAAFALLERACTEREPCGRSTSASSRGSSRCVAIPATALCCSSSDLPE